MPSNFKLAIAASFPPAVLAALIATLLFCLGERRRRFEAQRTQHVCWHRCSMSNIPPDLEAMTHHVAAHALHHFPLDSELIINSTATELQPAPQHTLQELDPRPLPGPFPQPRLTRRITSPPPAITSSHRTQESCTFSAVVRSRPQTLAQSNKKSSSLFPRPVSAPQLCFSHAFEAVTSGSQSRVPRSATLDSSRTLLP